MLATGGTAALVELRKASVSGQRLAVIAMAIDGSANMYYGKPGLAMEGGTYVKVVSGTIEGLLYS